MQEVEDKEKIFEKLKQIAGIRAGRKSQPVKTQAVQPRPVPVAEGRVLRGVKQRINLKKILLISSAILILIVLAFLVYYFFSVYDGTLLGNDFTELNNTGVPGDTPTGPGDEPTGEGEIPS